MRRGARPGNNTNWLFEVTGAEEHPPRLVSLSAWPNPFNPAVTIRYTTTHAGMTTVRIYDAAGGLVRTLVQEVRPRGEHTTAWDGRSDAAAPVASGVYFCRMESGGEAVVKKIVFMK